MNVAVGLTAGLGLDGDQCIRVIPQQLCDYLAYCEDYTDVSENFFIFRGGIPVQPLNFRKTLKQMICLAGLDQSYYSTHSLRAGRSCDLLKLGFSVETIKKLGRWHSNSVYAYLKNI